MNFIPFPAFIANQSAEAARASYEMSRHRKTPAQDYKIDDVACYRMPDGRVQTAYDLYAPMFPEGATPGIGMAQYKLRHYPNDSSGYETNVTNFRALDQILEEDGPQDMTVGAVARINGDTLLIIAESPNDLIAIRDAGNFDTFDMATVKQLGDQEAKMVHFFAATKPHDKTPEIMGAADERDLDTALRSRFSFVEAEPGFENIVKAITETSANYAWRVIYADRDDVAATLSDFGIAHERPRASDDLQP